jgi:esterase/lipase superfamily enzyme
VEKYTVDENNVRNSTRHLKHFLTEIRKRAGASKIHLVAHSMGSRALTAAVELIALETADAGGPVFNELILAAPDIDASEFRQIAKALVPRTDRVTVYVSSKDTALLASQAVHGGEHPRAGQSPPPLLVEDVDTVDVSDVSGGHAYVSNSDRILGDLGNILAGRELSPEIARKRALGDRVYWVLQ